MDPRGVKTLVESLIPVADGIRRSIHGMAGTRPYRVWRILTRWTGDRRGRGEEVVLEEREFLPTPRVSGVSGLDWALHAVGRDEEGTLEVSEVSLSLAQRYLQPQVEGNEQVYFEVRHDDGRRRRCTMQGAPEYDVSSMGWRFRMSIQDVERTDSGRPYR